jgi:hypothetical protein
METSPRQVGACSVGVPPANLGLRLVMETG